MYMYIIYIKYIDFYISSHGDSLFSIEKNHC